MAIKEYVGAVNIALLKTKAYLARDVLKQTLQTERIPSKSSWLNSVAHALGHRDFNQLLADGRFHRKNTVRPESETTDVIDTALMKLLQERLPASALTGLSPLHLDPAVALGCQSKQHDAPGFSVRLFDLQIRHDPALLYQKAISAGAQPATCALGAWLTFAACHPDPPAYAAKPPSIIKIDLERTVSLSLREALTNLWHLAVTRTGRSDSTLRGQTSVLDALLDDNLRSHDALLAAVEALSVQGYVNYSQEPWKVALTVKGQIYGLRRLTSEADWPEWLKASWELIRAQDERPCPTRLEPMVAAYAESLTPHETASRFAFEGWEREAIDRVASDIDRQLANEHSVSTGKRAKSLLVHIDPKLRLADFDISRWSRIKPFISIDVAVNGNAVEVPLVPTRPHPNKSYVRMRPRHSKTGLYVPIEPSALVGPVVITMLWKVQLSQLEGCPRSDVTIEHKQELIVTEQEIVSGILSASAASFEDERYSPTEMTPVVCYASRDYAQDHGDKGEDLAMAIRHHPRFLRYVVHFEHLIAPGEGIKQILHERIPLKTAELSHTCFKVY